MLLKLVPLLLLNQFGTVASQCTPWTHHFTNGLGPFSINGNAEVANGKLVMKMHLGDSKQPDTGVTMGYGARIDSTQPVHYGKFVAKMKASALPGCVTGFVMMSPSKDELDWEWVGKSATSSQTNYYVKGKLDYTKGLHIPHGHDISQAFHEYGVEWSESQVIWTIDGNTVRTVELAGSDIGIPSEPGNLIFSLWDGGAGLPGTSEWAGGKIDWSSPLLVDGKTTAEIEWVSYTC